MPQTKYEDTLKKLTGDAQITIDAPPGRERISRRDFSHRVRRSLGQLPRRVGDPEFLACSMSFFEYQSRQVNNVVRAVRSGNWAGEESTDPDSDVFKLRKPSSEPGVFQSVLRFLHRRPALAADAASALLLPVRVVLPRALGGLRRGDLPDRRRARGPR